ncbi:MAG: hypothetical protein JXR59_07525 [Desulfuromonadaceae bacterium]|nr:hypothetical protein [Desulfuromonadaceae bacterium]
MIDAMSTALSGMRAQTMRLESSANNVANSQTEGYVPSSVNMAEGVDGGVRTQLQKPVAATGVAQDAENKTSMVDQAKEMISMMESKSMYQANMKTVQTSERMVGNLLDTVG